MRYFILAAMILVGTTGFAQNKEDLSAIEEFKFYGVDFSLAKGFGVEANSIAEFIKAFHGINYLLVNETKKYDIAKVLGKKQTAISVGEVELLNEQVKDFFVRSDDYKINPDTLAQHIKALPVTGTGTGLIYVAELLNKAQLKGVYHLVFFDIETRNIIYTNVVEGKAHGFGLRNYWAGSLYNSMKNSKWLYSGFHGY